MRSYLPCQHWGVLAPYFWIRDNTASFTGISTVYAHVSLSSVNGFQEKWLYPLKKWASCSFLIQYLNKMTYLRCYLCMIFQISIFIRYVKINKYKVCIQKIEIWFILIISAILTARTMQSISTLPSIKSLLFLIFIEDIYHVISGW